MWALMIFGAMVCGLHGAVILFVLETLAALLVVQI